MQSDKGFQKIWVKLVDDSTECRHLRIAVNSICLITLVLLFILLVSNLVLGLTKVSYVILGTIIITAFLYYFARYKKRYHTVILIYTIVSYMVLGLNFLFNFGIDGPSVLGFFLTFLLLVAILERKYHLIIAFTHTGFLISLFAAQFYYPEWFPETYSSDMIRITDWSVTYIICLVFTYFIVMFLRENYQREKLLAQQQATDILEQNKKLKSLLAERDKLFSIVAHDISTPLTLIQGYLELINEAPIEKEPELKRYLLTITKRTSDMLMNMLTWCKSQMQGVTVDFKSFNINEILKEKLPLYSSIAEVKDISIDSSECLDVFVTADMDMTKAIFRNLLSNAIKFTPSKGKIKISIEKNHSYCFIHVSDTGIGMSVEKQNQLFNLNPKTTYGTQNEAGVGLGLVLCKEFVELQKGSITLISSENKGSTFTVGLPLS